jgi:hypothetical protein
MGTHHINVGGKDSMRKTVRQLSPQFAKRLAIGAAANVTIYLILLMLTGCATAPAWETAEIGCLERANAACIAAMQDGYPAGVVSCTLPRTQVRHAVTWIVKDGKTLYWDASFNCYRTQAELGRVWATTDGPSKGIFDLAPMPKAK